MGPLTGAGMTGMGKNRQFSYPYPYPHPRGLPKPVLLPSHMGASLSMPVSDVHKPLALEPRPGVVNVAIVAQLILIFVV